MTINPISRMLLTGLFIMIGAGVSHSAPSDDVAGQVIAMHKGQQISLPLLSSDYSISIAGTVATVQVSQTFSNPNDAALNAKYLFPLNQHAAVFAMKMEVGDEVIEAVIKEKAEAIATFEQAKSEGKTASLLTQHRPNMFTQDIANLMPNMPVKVTISYIQSLPKIDGAYSLVVPMIVAPRYGQKSESQITQAKGWQLTDTPAYPAVAGIDLPKSHAKPSVTMLAMIRSGLPINGFGSTTHALEITGDAHNKQVRFADSSTVSDRDLVITYSLEGDDIGAAGIGHFDETGGYVSLAIEPPKVVFGPSITPRELIFLIDTSGSQDGVPLQASKTFMTVALDALRPNDHFRIIQFANDVSEFSSKSVQASASNIAAGKRFVNNLSAGGGTDIDRAIKATFDLTHPKGALPIVVFLSDGLVGDEAEVIGRIRRDIGDARIYSFGVGASVNRYLMDGVAVQGRGYARYIDPTDNATDVAVRFAADLKTPVLTDIEIDWGGLDVRQTTPARIADLFDGGATRVYARYQTGGKHLITVKGKINGKPVALPIEVDLPTQASKAENDALPLIWARNRIADMTLDFNTNMGDRAQLKEQVIKLAIERSLQSQFTSFVAVSHKVYNDAPEGAVDKSVALAQVSGMSAKAYPTGLTGSSTPEPETMLGLMLALFLAMARYWKQIKIRLFSSRQSGAT